MTTIEFTSRQGEQSGADVRERVGKLRYPHDARWWSFRCSGLQLPPGDLVIVRRPDGHEAIAQVCTHPGPLPLDDSRLRALPEVIRPATPDERARRIAYARLEAHAFVFCRQKIDERQLGMRLLFVERPWHQKRLIFHFRAPRRVDFRELVKDLQHVYSERVILHWERERDYAKLVGGGPSTLWTPHRQPPGQKKRKRRNRKHLGEGGSSDVAE